MQDATRRSSSAAAMSDLKKSCPACNAWTSSVGIAFRDGEDCPYCGLPAEAAELIEKARDRNVAETVLERLALAERRAATAERKARQLQSALNAISRTIREAGESDE